MVTTDNLGRSSYFILLGFNIIYFATLFGIIFIKPNYINTFNICVHTFLCLFLMYRFNPLRKNIDVTKYDQIIVFSSAIFLLLNLGIIEIVKTSGLVDNNIMNIFENSTKSSS
jgi:hypothetical protein